MVSVADDAGQGGALFVVPQHHHHSSSSFFFSFIIIILLLLLPSSPRVHHLCCSLIITTHHGFFSKPHLRHLHSSSLLACQDMVLPGPQGQEGNSANADLPLCWLWAIRACSSVPLVHSASHSIVDFVGATTPFSGWRRHCGYRGNHVCSARILFSYGRH